MTSSAVPPAGDAVEPRDAGALAITVDGLVVEGLRGQTLAGVLLGSGRLSWRTTSAGGRPRGVFCGIGVCFDCIARVNGDRDVRLCQRRARDGDTVETQHDLLPGAVAHDPAAQTGAAARPDRAAHPDRGEHL